MKTPDQPKQGVKKNLTPVDKDDDEKKPDPLAESTELTQTSHKSSERLLQELRQGSEARHYINRNTPDGKETVEAIPLEWAVEIITAQKQAVIDDVLKLIEKVEKVNDSNGRYNACAELRKTLTEKRGL